MTTPVDTFEIVVRYDDELREEIEAGSHDPMGWIDTIEGGGHVLVGGDSKKGMREYLTSLFGGLLQALADCLGGEKAVLRTANGPLYIVLEPVEEDAIRFSLRYSKESAYSEEAPEAFEPSVVVRIESFVEEITDRAAEFESVVAEVNPELAAESSDYRGLREDIERAREVYRTRRDSTS